jgi:Tol biopolymer transport system component
MGMNPDGTDLVKLAEGRRPAWAPDSRQIVFERDSGLFLMNADGTEIRKLTDGFHRAPAWRR